MRAIAIALATLALTTALTFASAGPAAAQTPEPALGLGDHIVFAGTTSLFEGPLPRGPVSAFAPASELLDVLAYAPDGRLLAVQHSVTGLTSVTRLFEIGDGGGLVLLGTIDLPANEEVHDLAFGPGGRLYLLSSFFWWNPPDTVTQLRELDPASGAIRREVGLEPDVWALAPSPGGLWAVGDRRLFHLNPATGALTDAGVGIDDALRTITADTDATGALWILASSGITSPPVPVVYRLDPATGSRQWARFPVPQGGYTLAIRPQCRNTATGRCLQGGRFRAEVEWRDFEDRTGPGRTSASRSADSALFWFFDPANWELMAKVLDFCDHNGHFALFAAGMTNVAYTLEVTDLETGEVRTIENRLGDTAVTVTDTTAFPACP